MNQPVATCLTWIYEPSDRVRRRCLLLLIALVSTMLYLGSRPGIGVIFPYLPWDKLVHAIAYGGYAILGWVVMAGRSLPGPVLLAGAIGLLDEWVQYYSPGRTADVRDILADLVGAMLAVLVLKALRPQMRGQSRL
jgi:hypothetical protein